MLDWWHVVPIQYLEHNAQFLWRHWNWQLHHLKYIAEFSISKNILFLSILLVSKHVKPNIGKKF